VSVDCRPLFCTCVCVRSWLVVAITEAGLESQNTYCCRYNYQKIQGAMAEKAAAASAPADIEKQPMLHMSNGISSPDNKATTQLR
jgi:hypothetical protein